MHDSLFCISFSRRSGLANVKVGTDPVDADSTDSILVGTNMSETNIFSPANAHSDTKNESDGWNYASSPITQARHRKEELTDYAIDVREAEESNIAG
jgi:hypothetical protein